MTYHFICRKLFAGLIVGMSFLHPWNDVELSVNLNQRYTNETENLIHDIVHGALQRVFMPFIIQPTCAGTFVMPFNLSAGATEDPESLIQQQRFKIDLEFFRNPLTIATANTVLAIIAFVFKPNMLLLICCGMLLQIFLEISFKGSILCNEKMAGFAIDHKSLLNIIFRNVASTLLTMVFYSIATLVSFWFWCMIGILLIDSAFSHFQNKNAYKKKGIYPTFVNLFKFSVETMPIVLYYALYNLITNIWLKIFVLFLLDFVRVALSDYMKKHLGSYYVKISLVYPESSEYSPPEVVNRRNLNQQLSNGILIIS